MQQLMHLQDEI